MSASSSEKAIDAILQLAQLIQTPKLQPREIEKILAWVRQGNLTKLQPGIEAYFQSKLPRIPEHAPQLQPGYFGRAPPREPLIPPAVGVPELGSPSAGFTYVVPVDIPGLGIRFAEVDSTGTVADLAQNVAKLMTEAGLRYTPGSVELSFNGEELPADARYASWNPKIKGNLLEVGYTTPLPF